MRRQRLRRTSTTPRGSVVWSSLFWILLVVATTNLLILLLFHAAGVLAFVREPPSDRYHPHHRRSSSADTGKIPDSTIPAASAGWIVRGCSRSSEDTDTDAENDDNDDDDDTNPTTNCGMRSERLPTSNTVMTPEEVVTTCMSHLQKQQQYAGLEVCYNYSSDACRMANGGSLASFMNHANNPVFQTMVGCLRWDILNVGPIIPATATRGAMQTVLIEVVPGMVGDSHNTRHHRNDRQFLWTIIKERRPPRQGHCVVHECVAIDNMFAHTL